VSAPLRPPTVPDDREPELVVRARDGDREAFAALYHEHVRLVYGFLLARTRDRHLAEDLTQEVFVRALRHIGTYSWQGRAFGAWLTAIARNLFLDEIGRGRSRRETPVAEPEAPGQPGQGTESPVLRAYEAVEAHETVRTALRALNPYQRHCVQLRYLDELTAEETALAMGRSVGAVKTLTHRAMRKLRWSTEAVPA